MVAVYSFELFSILKVHLFKDWEYLPATADYSKKIKMKAVTKIIFIDK